MKATGWGPGLLSEGPGALRKRAENHYSELLMLGSEPQGQAGRPCHYMWACGLAATTGCGAHLQMAQGPDHPPLQSYQGMHSFRWAGGTGSDLRTLPVPKA